jgi:hypothetical protein
MTDPTSPVTPAAPTQPPESRTADAIAAARERLAAGGSILDLDAGSQPGEQPAGEEQPAAEGAEAQKWTVTLPGLEERGEKPLELEAPDQETYERLNRIQNEALVGRQVKAERQEIQRSRTELTELEDKVALDPGGFVLDQMQEADRTAIAMQLFFAPGVLEGADERLRASGYAGGLRDLLDDPEAQRTIRAESKASRLEMRDRLREQHTNHRAMQASAQRIVAEVDRLIPQAVTGERRDRLFRDAVRDIRDRCERLGLTDLDPRDVALLVGQRLHAQGAGSAALPRQPPAGPAARPGNAERAAMPAGELPKGTEERIKLARKVGLRALVERARATTEGA